MTDRIEKIPQELNLQGLDALLISSLPNIRYLTCYEARDAYLLVSAKKNVFITDFRYLYEARKNLKGIQVQLINGSLFKTIARTAKELKIKRLGFESKNLVYAEQQKIREELDEKIGFLPTFDLIEGLRKIKSPQELKKIKTATRIATSAMQFAKRLLKPGLSEIDVVFEIERFIRLEHGCKPSFDIIVASGPNSSFPHHISSERKLLKNEPVLIDLGVDFQGYKSDLTRVFFLGKIPAYAREIYEIVLAALKSAISEIQAGNPVGSIDNKARHIIAQKGYAKNFGHALGHGIGLEVHEEPHIYGKSSEELTENMVFTIEPAIYLPGKFGIRIEDMVWVKQKGSEVLSGNLDKRI
ncbi:MAG: Xaa-Pro peptidase family protein [Candidatus Omnitrophica bacterium]|nr:Xaa-Pro peptidase family protein [Candidatus Omnitrophota bacterium]